jgi:hypothetical protein
VLGADGGLDGAGAVLSAGALAAACSEEDEPVKEPHQRLTRLLLDAFSPVSEFAVVVHCPDALAVRAGASDVAAAAAWAFDP